MVRLTAAVLLLTACWGSSLYVGLTARSEMPMSTEDATTDLKITIVYENTLAEPRLTAGWGFSALIEYEGHTLLFDTGADGAALLNNMAALDIDPLEIDTVVLSHNHSDHTGGLAALLAAGVQAEVYVLPSFPVSLKQQVAQRTQVIEAKPDQIIYEGLFTTGEMDGSTPEQALAIEISRGIVIITGCAHPGIIAIVEHIKETSGKPVYLVLGGFHLKDKTRTEIATIVQAFRRLGVQRVGPCHCTGNQAIAAFAQEYGDDFVRIGTGTVIEIERLVEATG